MVRRAEALPPMEYVGSILDGVLGKLLRTAAKEVGHPLATSSSVWQGDDEVQKIGQLSSETPAEGIQRGSARIRFRETLDSGRYLFFVDTLFERDERTPTFSGFIAEGDIRMSPNGPTIRCSTWIVKREAWSWETWM